MYLQTRRLIERSARWFLRRRKRPLPIRATIEQMQASVQRVAEVMPNMLRGIEAARLEQDVARYIAQGVPEDLARRVARLEPLYAALDITELAQQSGRDVDAVASLYCVVGHELRLDWLRDRVVELPRADRWQALSRGAMREDAEGEHRAVTAAVLAQANGSYEQWAAENSGEIARVLALLDDIRTHAVYDLATLSVALREIRALA
jgi:glutamate dehydrogenase